MSIKTDTQINVAQTSASARNQKGLTTVEYAVAGGVIAAGLVALFALLGTEIYSKINAIYTALVG